MLGAAGGDAAAADAVQLDAAEVLLLGAVAQGVAGFATNPLILLLPIGAGTLVAAIIIFILVKSAG